MAIVVHSKQYFAVPSIEIEGQIHQEPNSNLDMARYMEDFAIP